MTIKININELESSDLWIDDVLWLGVNVNQLRDIKDGDKDGGPYKQIPLQRIIQDGLVANGLSLDRASHAADAYIEWIESQR